MLTDKQLEATKTTLQQIKSIAKETGTDERVVAEAMSIAQCSDSEANLGKIIETATNFLDRLLEEARGYRPTTEVTDDDLLKEAERVFPSDFEVKDENGPAFPTPDEVVEEVTPPKKKR